MGCSIPRSTQQFNFRPVDRAYPRPGHRDPHRRASSAFLGAFILRELPEPLTARPTGRIVEIAHRLSQAIDSQAIDSQAIDPLGVDRRLSLGRQSSLDRDTQ